MTSICPGFTHRYFCLKLPQRFLAHCYRSLKNTPQLTMVNQSSKNMQVCTGKSSATLLLSISFIDQNISVYTEVFSKPPWYCVYHSHYITLFNKLLGPNILNSQNIAAWELCSMCCCIFAFAGTYHFLKPEVFF